MRHIVRWLGIGALCALIAACGGGGSDNAPSNDPPPAANHAQLTVSVFDTLGRAVEGAVLKSAAASATTGADGRAVLAVPVGSAQAIAVEKAGFAEQVKRVELAAGTASAELRAFIVEREAAISVAAIDAAGSVSGKDGVRIAWPANAFVDAGGRAVNGAAQVQLTPLDVSRLDLGAFPGAFEGTPTGASAPGAILSYGTAELLPQQGGVKLQLASGKQVEIDLPVYIARHPDGTAANAGDTIALWSLDAATGLWRQEGSGTLVASAASPSGLVMRASIGHFSWWNIDRFSARGTVTLTVQVPGQTVPAGTPANVEARVVAGSGPTSASNDTFIVGVAKSNPVPAAPTTTRLTATVQLGDRVCSGERDVSPAAGATVAITIDATSCLQVSVPRIVEPAGTIATNSSRPVRVQVLIDGNPLPDEVEVFAGNTSIARFAVTTPLPWFTAFFDTAQVAEGTYAVTARATRLGQSRTSNAVQVVVDRTPPTMQSIEPAPGAEVSGDTVFAILFDEPVTALPFALGDVVKLAVTPSGGGTPQEVPARVEFDASFSPQQRVLVTPLAPLPSGIPSVSWAGLKDAAGNAVAGTVAATYALARFQTLFVQAVEINQEPPQLAIASDGRIVAAWAESDGLLRVGVRSAAGVALFGAPADNPITLGSTNSLQPQFALALDATDRPVLATVSGTPGAFDVVVRRFESGAWVTLGTPFRDNGDQARNLRLVIDGQGRIVLGYFRFGVSETKLHRFANGAWASLGAPGANLSRFLDSGLFDLALTPDDRPLIALLRDDVFGTSLHVVRLDGASWTSLGGVIDQTSHCGGCGFAPPRLVGGSDGPWLQYAQGQTPRSRLLRFDGTSWQGGDLPFLGRATALALLNGVPVIANAGGGVLDVQRFVNGAFEPLATTSSGPGQLSIATRGSRVVLGLYDLCCNLIVQEVR